LVCISSMEIGPGAERSPEALSQCAKLLNINVGARDTRDLMDPHKHKIRLKPGTILW
jgi:hypothetical protein